MRFPGLPIRGAASIARKLEEHRETAFLSKRLATLAEDAPIGDVRTIEDLEYHGAIRSEVDPLFERLGFGTIYDRIPRWSEVVA